MKNGSELVTYGHFEVVYNLNVDKTKKINHVKYLDVMMKIK